MIHPGLRPEDIDELESHLRDTMDALRQVRLDETEAFLIASRRLGHPSALEEEYLRARPGEVWRQRAIWMVVGVMALGLFTQLGQLLSNVLLIALGSRLQNGVILGYASLGVQATLLAGVVVWFDLKTRPGRLPAWQRGLPSTAAAIAILLGLGMAVKLGNAVAMSWAIVNSGPAVLGQFYMVQTWGVNGLTILVAGIGCWLARGLAVTAGRGATATLLLLISLLASPGCNSSSNPPSAPESTPATAKTRTPFEQCLTLIESDTNAAVAAFMKIDPAKDTLFTAGSPLAYSEAEFIKLPPAVMDSMSPPMHAELEALKRIVREVKSRREQARQTGDLALAEAHTRQLAALATRLQRPDQLQLTRQVGKTIAKLTSE